MAGLEILEESTGKLSLNEGESRHALIEITGETLSFDAELKEDSSLILEIVNSYKGNAKQTFRGKFDLSPRSSLKLVVIDFSANDVDAKFDSALKNGAEFNADLASVAALKQEKTYDLTVLHAEPNGHSLVRMFGVLNDEAKLSFFGTSDIPNGSKKTVTRQEGHIADFSSEGKAEVSPVLKIAENDVKAGHAATLGKIPDESLFYLMSRGLSKSEATALMTIGFLKPIVNEISSDSLRESLNAFVEKRSR